MKEYVATFDEYRNKLMGNGSPLWAAIMPACSLVLAGWPVYELLVWVVIRCWRRGSPRQKLLISGGTMLFLLLGMTPSLPASENRVSSIATSPWPGRYITIRSTSR